MGRSSKLLQSVNREENNLLSAVFLLLLTSSARLCLYNIEEKKMGNVILLGKFFLELTGCALAALRHKVAERRETQTREISFAHACIPRGQHVRK